MTLDPIGQQHDPRLPKDDPRLPDGGTLKPQGQSSQIGNSARKVYEALCENQNLTMRSMAGKLRLSKTTILKALKELSSCGLVKHVGPRFGGHWEVLPV